MSENLLTVAEAADILKVKKNTVYEMIKRGDLKASKLGKQLRIRQEDLEEYIRYGGKSPADRSLEVPGFKKPVQYTVPVVTEEQTGKPVGRVIICGQDAVLDLLAEHLSRQGEGLQGLRSYKGSYNALYALYQGQVDVATAHLWHGATDSYNLPYIGSMLPGTDVVVIHLLKRRQGFYVKKDNPKQILSFEDLKREDVRMVNREPGSGSRVLMDEKLRLARIRPSEIRGYHTIVNSHLEAAAAVAAGEVDVALGTEKHCQQVSGLDFVFQQEESYDMVIRREDFFMPSFQVLVEILCSQEYQNEVKALGGYDVTDMGKIIYMDRD